MLVQEILQNLTKVYDLQPLEIISSLIILSLIVWLYKEFKMQYQTNKQLRTNKSEGLAKNISHALYIANNYNADSSKEFFLTIYACFPYWNFEKIKEIKNIIEDASLDEKNKIEKISEELYKQLDYLSVRNRELLDIKSGNQILEYVVLYLKDIFVPIVQTIITFLLITSLFILSFGIENKLISLVKIMSLLFLLMLPFAFYDMYKEERLEKSGKFMINILLISLIASLMFSDWRIVGIAGGIFIFSLFYLIKRGLKNQTRS